MTKKTEAAVVRAAMRWFGANGFFFDGNGRVFDPLLAKRLEDACHTHAKSVKEKRK